ncbi:MAG TPA: LPS assembly protein LptD [Rhizomicrobium sp.]
MTTLALGLSALAPFCLPPPAAAEALKPTGDVLLQADEAIYYPDRKVVVAKGNVEIEYDGRILLADSVTYDQSTDEVTADGHVSLLDKSGNVAFAKQVKLSDRMRDGALQGFGAWIGENGRLVAASAQRSEGRFTTARNVAYTPCKICNQPGRRTPVWQIKASRVVHDEEKRKIQFKDATVAFFGVPLLYTPYLTKPDPSVRYASGLLTPDIGSSSSTGYFLRLPYYYSISPSQDATIEPLITTRGGNLLLGEYRQRWNDGGMWLQGSVGENPNGGFGGERFQAYTHFFGSGRFQLSPSWQAGFDAQLTSNETYLKRYNISQLDRLVNDVFAVGEYGRSRFAVTGYFFQGLRASDDNRTFPVALPLVEYTYIPLRKWFGGQFRMDVNGVALSRDIGANNQRTTAEARWRYPLVASDGELLTLQLNLRGDLYHTDTPAPLPSDSHYITRGLPYAALDWRWPFIASGKSGRSYIVEPIAQVVVSPYGGNPVNIPNEDSLNVEIDDNNIFSFDQVPGRDLVETGPRANFGVRAESRFSFGYIEGLVGQTFRLKSDPIFADDTGMTGKASDVVGRFSIKFPPYLDLTHRIAVDAEAGTVRRNEVYLTGVYGRSSTQISYIQLAPTLGLPAREEVNTQMDVNFYRNWQGFAAIRRDLISDQMLDTEFGIGYEDECLGISVAYRRKYTSDRDLPPSTSFILRINLKTADTPIQPFSLFPQDVFSYTHP